jgi:hypothetical protein
MSGAFIFPYCLFEPGHFRPGPDPSASKGLYHFLDFGVFNERGAEYEEPVFWSDWQIGHTSILTRAVDKNL